ncbi:MAG: HAMP domain-containing protein [Chloroflexi bacterium]|nr:HAMP domain-containing protein [Chloroflexota bacterium]
MVEHRNDDSSPSPHRFRLPRVGIAAQIYLGVLALALALLIAESAAWLETGQQARAQAEIEIEDGLDGFQTDLVRATRELTTLGDWLVEQKTFNELVHARDSATLAKYLEPWTGVNIVDSLLVCDTESRSLVRLGEYAALTHTTGLDLPGMADAREGKRVAGLAQDNAGRLQGRVILPIYANGKSLPSGTLYLGFYLDRSFLQYRFRKLDQEIAIVYHDNLYIITLTDVQGLVWGGKTAPAAILKAQREGRASGFVTVETDIGNYLFKFKPMQFAATNGGMYGIGVSASAIDTLRANLFRTFGISIIVIAIGLGVGAYLFSRHLTRPLRQLSGAARAMAHGDLSNPIRLARNDELGDLARELDRTRDQLRHALQTATLEHNRYAAVIQSMGAAAIISDHNLVIAAVNSAAEALLQQSRASLIGQRWHHVFCADGQANGASATTWALGEVDMTNEHELVVRGRFPLCARPQLKLDVISTQVQLDGAAAGFVHILYDATTQEQLVRAKDEFIMNAAHEFRGPLASLRASIELLAEDYATMSKQDLGVMLRAMQRAVVKFQGLVENLIDVGNIQAGRFRVRTMPVRLSSLIEDALDQMTPLLQGRAQSAQVRLESLAGCIVLADRARITQVLINLLTNASKYGPEGEPITFTAENAESFVTLRVTDRGPGIQPEEQSRLFQRFYRGRRAEEEGIGIGLGLALAREIVQLHGGQIGVESRVGEGTTFWFSLPRVESPESKKA